MLPTIYYQNLKHLLKLWAKIEPPKNPWTLQWKGLNLYDAGVFLGPQNDAIFEGSGFLGPPKLFRMKQTPGTSTNQNSNQPTQ